MCTAISTQWHRAHQSKEHAPYLRCSITNAHPKQICIAAADYEPSAAVVDMMTAVGLQPEPEQEKRMLQACFDPSQHKGLDGLEQAAGASSEEERRGVSADEEINEE